jgi:hypothetical protein
VLVDRKPFVYVWKPFYRFVHDRVVVHYLERLKAFFWAESHAQLSYLTATASQIDRQVSTFESNERMRWTAFEQLYLCWLSDPDRATGSETEQSFHAERGNDALRAHLAGHLAAFDQRNQAMLDRLTSMDVQNRSLLDTLTALDRNHRTLSTRLESLEAETRFRWQAMEELLTAFLSDRDRSTLTSLDPFRVAQEHSTSAGQATPCA